MLSLHPTPVIMMKSTWLTFLEHGSNLLHPLVILKSVFVNFIWFPESCILCRCNPLISNWATIRQYVRKCTTEMNMLIEFVSVSQYLSYLWKLYWKINWVKEMKSCRDTQSMLYNWCLLWIYLRRGDSLLESMIWSWKLAAHLSYNW